MANHTPSPPSLTTLYNSGPVQLASYAHIRMMSGPREFVSGYGCMNICPKGVKNFASPLTDGHRPFRSRQTTIKAGPPSRLALSLSHSFFSQTLSDPHLDSCFWSLVARTSVLAASLNLIEHTNANKSEETTSQKHGALPHSLIPAARPCVGCSPPGPASASCPAEENNHPFLSAFASEAGMPRPVFSLRLLRPPAVSLTTLQGTHCKPSSICAVDS